jgi:hypothetical protein
MIRVDNDVMHSPLLYASLLKVHLGPYLILVIENNPNKNLIVSMSIKQEFRQPKRRKGKRPPNSCQFK